MYSIEETLQMLLEDKHDLHPGQARPFRLPSQQPEPSSQAIHVHLDPRQNARGGLIASSDRGETQEPILFEDTVDGMAAITFSNETESGFFGAIFPLTMHQQSYTDACCRTLV